MINPTQKFPCAGVIVMKGSNPSSMETIVVTSKKGRMSFPKGKMEKGENYLEAALREMNEETGLTKDDVELVKDKDGKYIWIEEQSDKGNPSIVYFIGKYIKKTPHKFAFDEDELTNAQFYKIDDVHKLDLLKSARKDVLNKAIAQI